MNAIDRQTFAELLDRVYATWGKPSPSDRVMDAAIDALEDFDIEIIQTACKAKIAAGGRFMPSTADLVEECRLQRQQTHRAYAPTTVGEDVCAACEGCGQVQTRTEVYEAAPNGKPARQMTRVYVAPCPRCEKGRRFASNRIRTATPRIGQMREAS